MVRIIVQRYRHRAARFVTDKVKDWDSRQMSDKLELSIGRNLQSICINGTLVRRISRSANLHRQPVAARLLNHQFLPIGYPVTLFR